MLNEPSQDLGAQSQCVHQWIIDPPRSEKSTGTCVVCGDQKEFHNHATSAIARHAFRGNLEKKTDMEEKTR